MLFNTVWGHAISNDLLHWKNLPIAISNDEPYDAGGVFTGSTTLINNDTLPIIMYVNSKLNKWCIAYPNNTNDVNLTQWTNYNDNCVLNAPNDCPNGDDGAPTTSWTVDNGKTWIMAYAVSGIFNVYHVCHITSIIHSNNSYSQNRSCFIRSSSYVSNNRLENMDQITRIRIFNIFKLFRCMGLY